MSGAAPTLRGNCCTDEENGALLAHAFAVAADYSLNSALSKLSQAPRKQTRKHQPQSMAVQLRTLLLQARFNHSVRKADSTIKMNKKVKRHRGTKRNKNEQERKMKQGHQFGVMEQRLECLICKGTYLATYQGKLFLK